MKGVILHGGHGTRLRPLTFTGPKQLIPVANKPISQYVLEDLTEAGINEIAIVLGDIHPDKVKEHYGDGSRFGAKITYIFQGEPKGIAHAVSLCQQFVGEDPFVVYLGDNLLKGGIILYAQAFTQQPNDAMILLSKVKEPERFGVAEFRNGKLNRLVEKPRQPPSPYALTGIYLFKPTIFPAISRLKPSRRGELEITEAIQHLIDQGKPVAYQKVEGWWKDTGTSQDILDANRLVLDELHPSMEGVVEEGATVEGRVAIDRGTLVKKGATVRGPAIIGREATIRGNVYIGPYTSIGNQTTICRGEVENSIIMNNCHIDIEGRITSSIVGPNSNITTDRNTRPTGHRFILGDHSEVQL